MAHIMETSAMVDWLKGIERLTVDLSDLTRLETWEDLTNKTGGVCELIFAHLVGAFRTLCEQKSHPSMQPSFARIVTTHSDAMNLRTYPGGAKAAASLLRLLYTRTESSKIEAMLHEYAFGRATTPPRTQSFSPSLSTPVKRKSSCLAGPTTSYSWKKSRLSASSVSSAVCSELGLDTNKVSEVEQKFVQTFLLGDKMPSLSESDVDQLLTHPLLMALGFAMTQ